MSDDGDDGGGGRGECAHHLPGNRQCPIPALYCIAWKRGEGIDPKPMRYLRDVCPVHLMPAIDEAIGDMGNTSHTVEVRFTSHTVEVRLLWPL